MSARVLLVEDEPDIQLIARAALMRAGFDVLTARDGVEALALAESHAPDLILLDWMLPQLDGFETCVRLKAGSRTQRIPVVFFTANTNAGDQARCLALGALGCITKPFNPLSLGDQVKALWRSPGGRTPEDART